MTNNTENLNPCPFCGSKDVRRYLTIGMKWVAGCDACGCRTRECTHSIDAVNSWNRRADDQEEAKHISAIMSEMMSRGYPDDDFEENHMSMPIPVEETPF